jgi:hypothetical protein
VRTLDTGQMRQRFLGDTFFNACCPHRSAEGLCWRRLEGRRAWGPSSLNNTLLHRQ